MLLLTLGAGTAAGQGDGRTADPELVAAVQVALLRGRVAEVHDVRVLADALRDLRGRLPEARARSASDARRATLARRILALDPAHALANEEAALGAYLDYAWRRRNAVRRGLWRDGSPQVEAALRAQDRAASHLDRALDADPSRLQAHRLRLRLYLLDDPAGQFGEAAAAALAALPLSADAHLWAGLAARRAGRLDDAERAFRAGLARLPDADRRVFESPARFVRPDDHAAWTADSAAWSEQFWRARDPRLLTPVNERWQEHVTRLLTADLLYAFGETRGWDTARGDLFVRYGAPRFEGGEMTLAPGGLVYTWFYPDVSFSFHDLTASGEVYLTSSAEGEDSATRARTWAHTTGETFTPTPPTIPLVAQASVFRGTDGRQDVVVAYSVPTGHDGRLRTGAFLLDSTAAPRAQAVRTHDRVPSQAATLSVEPGAYTVAVEAEHSATGAYGVVRSDLRVRDLHASGLVLSDLLLATASDDEPGAAPVGWVRRGDVRLQPAPQAVVATDAPLVVYAEAYGLARDEGRTRYTVEARVEPVDRAGVVRRLGRLLRGRRPPPGVAVAFDAAGDAADEAVRLDLDLTALAPGSYTLTLTVRDLVAGRDRSATRRVLLDPPVLP